jgi:hypothetical protein
MKRVNMNEVEQVGRNRRSEKAGAGSVLLALVCFVLGVAVTALWFSRNAPSQTVAQTAQLDLSVAEADATPAPSVALERQRASEEDAAALAVVKSSIRNVKSTSESEGTRILREAALADFQHAVQELQARQKKAEQLFIQGQRNNSEEQQRAATKELQQLQVEQMEKLKEIAARSKAEIETFTQLKRAGR